jgi:general L-amino acid transport system permease protein
MARDVVGSHPSPTVAGASVVWWRNPAVRGIIAQAVVVAAVIGLGYYLVSNLHQHGGAANTHGFGFLQQQAGFAIGEIAGSPYRPPDSYGRAFVPAFSSP